MGVILEGKKDNLSGKDLKYVFDFRHGKGSLEKYNYIRLISCCSAEGINPLGQQVADEFGLETKAYKGLVLSLPPEVLDANKLNSEFIGTRPDGKTIDYNKILINAKQTYVVKLPPTTPEKLAKWTGYSPVKFKPKNLSQKV